MLGNLTRFYKPMSSQNLELSSQWMPSLYRCNRYCCPSVVNTSLTGYQEETELFTDGSRRLIRPARLGLARVSVIRGSGDKEGVPFIDDYIHTSEEIVDYLTEFSGIQRKVVLESKTTALIIQLSSWGPESAHVFAYTGAVEGGLQEAQTAH
jgi:hypothetical protein